MTDTEALSNFRNDPRFGALAEARPAFPLFSVLGVARDEVAHSRLIAALFDSRSHSHWRVALRAFLAAIAASAPDPRIVSALRGCADTWDRVRVYRERFRLDVILDLGDKNGGIVIGIENKIDAAERPAQIRDYQRALRTGFPGRLALMLFLTPDGRPPETAADNDTPHAAISYSHLCTVVNTVRTGLGVEDSDASALAVVERHIREELMGEPNALETAVRELWRDHPRALRLLCEYRPRFADLLLAYEAGIREALGAVEFGYYPNRGDVREIKFQHPHWPADRPFTFILHEREGRLDARVLIYSDRLKRNRSTLRKWAAAVNVGAPGLLDDQFRPVAGWTVWHRVFNEEDWPAEATVEYESTFSSDAARAAVRRMLELIATLQPHIETLN